MQLGFTVLHQQSGAGVAAVLVFEMSSSGVGGRFKRAQTEAVPENDGRLMPLK